MSYICSELTEDQITSVYDIQILCNATKYMSNGPTEKYVLCVTYIGEDTCKRMYCTFVLTQECDLPHDLNNNRVYGGFANTYTVVNEDSLIYTST